MPELPRLSDAALEHLALLMGHRNPHDDDDAIKVFIYPGKCDHCAEIEKWSEAIKEHRHDA